MYKKINLFVFLVIITFNNYLNAQITPEGILFQAVAKDINGNAAAGRNIFAKVNLLKGTANGSIAYAESFKVVSSDDGIFTLIIGKGLRTSGASGLAAIDWDADFYFINIKIAIEPSLPMPGWSADSEYQDMGTSQLWSVPYALFASRSSIADSALSISTIVPSAKGGTGVNNNGKTISVAQNISFKGVGDISFSTTGASNISLPTTGLLANTQYVSDRFASDTISLSKRIDALTINTDTNTALKLNIADTGVMLAPYFRKVDTINMSKRIDVKLDSAQFPLLIAPYLESISGVKYADTAAMLLPYARKVKTDSALALKLNSSDTAAMLLPYARKVKTDSALALKLNSVDTAAMLLPYARKVKTDSALALKLNSVDTAAMLLPYATLNNVEALTNKTINGITPTVLENGFQISGGTITNTTVRVVGDVTIGGVNSGDQLITLIGDVSGSGTGIFNTTINSVGGIASSVISSMPTAIASNTLSITSNTTNIATNRSNITALDTRVATNTTNITAEITRATAAETTLDTKIATNTASITAEITRATNAENGLDARVTNNTIDIVTNRTGITMLDTRVTSNAANIATNTTDITTNKSDILSLDTRVTSNTSSITSETIRATAAETALDTRVSSNTASITTNTNDIAVNRIDITTLGIRVASNTTSITANTVDIATNRNSITAMDARVANNANNIITNTNDIATNTADITALDTRVTSNTASITTNTTDITTNRNNITALDTRVTSNTASITTNTTNIATNSNSITALDTRVTSNTASITTNTTDIATNSNSINALDTRVTSNTARIITNTSDIATNTSAITTNTNAIATNTADITVLDTRVTSNTASITTNTAGITALDTRVTSNTASITTNTLAIASNTASITTNTAGITALDTRVTSNTASITTNTTDIATNSNSIIALDTRVTSNTASITTNTADIATNTAGIITLDTRVTSNTSNITAETTRATSAETDLDVKINANTASITTNTIDLATKAPINSPSFTGIPIAPTAGLGTRNNQIATTEFVNNAISGSSVDLSGGQITGVIPVANGGTGQSTYTDGQLLIGNSAGNTLAKSTLTAGAGVSILNGNGAITISATGSGGTVSSLNPINITTSGSSISSSVISATSTPQLTMNIPMATYTSTTGGLLSNADYVLFKNKQTALSAGSGISLTGTTIAATGLTTSNLSGSAGILNAQLANSSVTLGISNLSLGGTYTSLVGLTSISSTGFTGALTGNASTATALQTSRSIYGNNFDGTTALTGLISTTYGGTGTASATQNYVFAGPATGATAGAPSFRALVPADLPASSGNYIWNGTALQSSANFNISGAGIIGTTLNVGTSISAGTLSLTNALSVVNGGTGANSITGLVKGNGIGAMTSAIGGTDYLMPNASITGSTKTKITFDAKGLITSGTDATTADITESANKKYVTDAQSTILSNTSGTNTGDQTFTLTGDLTGTGTGTISSTIANGAVSYAKMQNMPTKTLLGNKTTTTSTAGPITLGAGLSLSDLGILSATGTGGTVTGTGTVGEMPFWSTATGLSSTPNFIWDNTNKNIKIGENVDMVGVDGDLPSGVTTPIIGIVGKVNDLTEQTMLSMKRPLNYGNSVPGFVDFVMKGGNNSTKFDIRMNNFTNPTTLVNVMTILTPGGYVGINNSAPTEKLDVTGTIRFSGALKPNNLSGTAGQFLTSQGAGTPTWTTPSNATASNNGFLSSTDWTIFNNKFSLPALTSGSVLFSNGTTLTQDNTNLFWDNTNNRLGLLTSSPQHTFQIGGETAENLKFGLMDTYYNTIKLGYRTTGWALRASNNSGVATDLLFSYDDGTTKTDRMTIGTTGGIAIPGTLNVTGAMTAGTGNLANLNVNNGKLYYNATNDKFGVFTSAPTSMFQIGGDGNFDNPLKYDYGGETSSLKFGFRSKEFRISTSTNSGVLLGLVYSYYNGTTNTESMRLGYDGLVSIGNLSTASFKYTGGTPGAGKVLTSDANGVATWAAAATGIGGAGTANYLPKFNASTSVLGNSILYDDGTSLFVNGTSGSGGTKLVVNSGARLLPTAVANATTQTGAALRIANTSNDIMDMGTGSNNGWIQVADKLNLASNYSLLLNPNGGNVGIGMTTNPTSKLQVNGDIAATSINGLVVKSNGSNVVLGQGNVLASLSTGANNVAVGQYTLNYLETGSNNLGMGYSAMYNTRGSNNVGLGHEALYTNNAGNYNTALGHSAGYANTGSNNTFLGYQSNSSGAITNATAIGNGATVTANNTIQLGNASVTEVKTSGVFSSQSTGTSSVAGKFVAGTNTAASASAVLEANSTTQGFLPPRMTLTQRDAIASPVKGLIIMCSDCGVEYGAQGEVQVYNGTAWRNIAGTQASGTTVGISAPAIGSNYEGGVVAYILAPGDAGYEADKIKGFVVAASDVSYFGRLNGGTNIAGITNTDLGIGGGLTNFEKLVAAYGTVNTGGTKAAYDYTVTENGITYDDWYIPSRGEFLKLYANRVAIGVLPTSTTYYWTSNQCNGASTAANYARYSDGFVQCDGTERNGALRLIRNFVIDPQTSITATNFKGTATKATNISGGSAGAIPYQTAAGATSFSAAGNTGQIFTSNGASSPTWVTTLPIANGGTGSSTKNFIDLSTSQTIDGLKTFTTSIVSNSVTIGKGAGQGSENTAVGTGALGSGNGSRNTALGYNALSSYNGAGFDNNTSVGYANMSGVTNGTHNTSMGAESVASLGSGSHNTAIGNHTLRMATSSYNTVLGASAGNIITTGDGNTIIGRGADVSVGTLGNATAIGYGTIVSASNTVRIGNTSITSIGGQVAWTAASDARIKKNIVNSKYGLETVLKLRPVEYNLLSNDLKQVGFIAQEVQKLVPEVVTGKEGDISKGEVLGITYSNLVPVLAKSIQELNAQKNEEIAALKIAVSNITSGESLSVKHLKGTSATPVIEAAEGSGNSATVTITGTDMSGVIEIITGDATTANAVLASIEYSTAYSGTPVVMITPGNAPTASLMGTSTVFVGKHTNINFTLNTNATPLATKTTYKWYYQVIQ